MTSPVPQPSATNPRTITRRRGLRVDVSALVHEVTSETPSGPFDPATARVRSPREVLSGDHPPLTVDDQPDLGETRSQSRHATPSTGHDEAHPAARTTPTLVPSTSNLLSLWDSLGPAFTDSWQALSAFGVLGPQTSIELWAEENTAARATVWHSPTCRRHPHAALAGTGTTPSLTKYVISAEAITDVLDGARLDSCIESVHTHPVFANVDPGVLHAAYWMTWAATPTPVDEHAMLSAASRLRYLILTVPRIPATTHTANAQGIIGCQLIADLVSARVHALNDALHALERSVGYQVALGRHLAAEMRLRVLRDPHQQCAQLPDPLGDAGLVHDALAVTAAHLLDPDDVDHCPMTAGEMNRRAVMQRLLDNGAPSPESRALAALLPRLRERSCWILLTTPSSFALLRAAEEIHATPGPFSIAKVPALLMVGNDHRAPILLTDGTYTSKDAQLAARMWRAEGTEPLDAFVAAYRASLDDTQDADSVPGCGHGGCLCLATR